MAQITKKRQNFANSIRRKQRSALFAQKRSKFSQSVCRQTLPQVLELFFKGTIPQQMQIQVMITAQQSISILSEVQLTQIIELCERYLKSSELRKHALATLVEITNYKSLTPQTAQMLRKRVMEKVIGILKSSKEAEQKIDCCYIYGNLIVDVGIKNESDFKVAQQILNVFNKQQERLDGSLQAVQGLVWMMRNSILIFIKTNSKTAGSEGQEDLRKQKQKSFGGYCLTILCEIVEKQLRRQLQTEHNQNSEPLDILMKQLDLCTLILTQRMFSKEYSLKHLDHIIFVYFGQQSHFDKYLPLNHQVANICILMADTIGVTKGIRSTIGKILDRKISVPNSLDIFTKINQLGVMKLNKLTAENNPYKFYADFIDSMNSKLYPILDQELKHPMTLTNKVPRRAVLRYILSNPTSIKTLQTESIFNLLDVALIDADYDHVLDGLTIIEILVSEAEEVELSSEVKRLIQEFGIGNTLLDLQSHTNKEVYEKAMEIIQKVNLQE